MERATESPAIISSAVIEAFVRWVCDSAQKRMQIIYHSVAKEIWTHVQKQVVARRLKSSVPSIALLKTRK